MTFVMAGLPGHDVLHPKFADARHKAGHDECLWGGSATSAGGALERDERDRDVARLFEAGLRSKLRIAARVRSPITPSAEPAS
jgi:hypothetical protein